MRMRKYHGLGNDYLTLRPEELQSPLTPERIQRLCHRHYGPGSDGILLGPFLPGSADYAEIARAAGEVSGAVSLAAVRIFNPDGSEAEKSGNGLRIFSRFLYDLGLAGQTVFYLSTLGGQVAVQIEDPAQRIRVDMGIVSFDSAKIPVSGPAREVLQESVLLADGSVVTVTAAGIGNPHCIVLQAQVSPELARRLGPQLEVHPMFPRRTNVQFMQILDRHRIAIEIWERGAGYTLASGSSASACAAAAVRLGWCDSPVTVVMPGGELHTEVGHDYRVAQSGPVAFVYDAMCADDL